MFSEVNLKYTTSDPVEKSKNMGLIIINKR